MGAGRDLDRRRLLAAAATFGPVLAGRAVTGGILSGGILSDTALAAGALAENEGPAPASQQPGERVPTGQAPGARAGDSKPREAGEARSGGAGAPDGKGRKAAWLNYEFLISWERVTVLQELVTGLVDKGYTDLTLLISSNGGDVAAAISTFNFLTSTGLRLTTCNVGNVYSAGVMLFLAGERRVADLATQFIIHPPSQTTVVGAATLEDFRLRAEALDHDALRMRDLIVARSKMTAAQLDPMLGRTTFIAPQQAVGYGIATEVGHLVRPKDALLVTMPLPSR